MMEDEIESESEDERDAQTFKKSSVLKDDPFLMEADEGEKETADEKRLKMTK
jgi:hypothetical protein